MTDKNLIAHVRNARRRLGKAILSATSVPIKRMVSECAAPSASIAVLTVNSVLHMWKGEQEDGKGFCTDSGRPEIHLEVKHVWSARENQISRKSEEGSISQGKG